MTHTRVSRFGLLFGRVSGLLLAGAGAFAAWALYFEFKVWTDSLIKQISMAILCGGAVAFALIQGMRMFLAKTPTQLGFTVGVRFFGVAMVIAFFLLAVLFKLPAAVADGPLAVILLLFQAAVVVAGLMPLLRRRQDGA